MFVYVNVMENITSTPAVTHDTREIYQLRPENTCPKCN